MLTRLSLCLALVAALGGCASYESRYYDEQVVYRDGDYYVPADADRGDYYYGPDDDGYADDYRYGYLPYAPYDPSFGFAGFDGYCSVAYAVCLPWWAGSYLDPRFRFSFGYGNGWSLGYVPVYGGVWGYWGSPYRGDRHRDHRHDGDGGWDRDHDHGGGDHHGHGADRGPTAPPPVARPAPAPGPDVSRPAPVERMPRPVFGGRFKDPRPEPVPARPPPDTPQAAPVEDRPWPIDSRWRESRPSPLPERTPPERTLPRRPPIAPPPPAPRTAPAPPRVPEARREGSRTDDDAPRPRRLRGQPPPG